MKLLCKTIFTVKKAIVFSTSSILLAIIGLLLSSLSIRELNVIYLSWLIWFIAFLCGVKSLIILRNIKDAVRVQIMAIIGCIFSVIFTVAVTFMINNIYIVKAAHCRGNLYVLGRAVKLYCDNHEGNFPTPSKWCDLIINEANEVFDISRESFNCQGESGGISEYALNENIFGKQVSEVGPKTVILFETTPGWNQNGGQELMTLGKHKLLFRKKVSYVLCFGEEKPVVMPVHEAKIKELCWIP